MLKRNRTTTCRKMIKVAQRDSSSLQLSCLIIVSRFCVALGIYYRKTNSFLHVLPLLRKKVFQIQNISKQFPIYFNINKNVSCVFYLATTEKNQLYHLEKTVFFSHSPIKEVIDNYVFCGFRVHFWNWHFLVDTIP